MNLEKQLADAFEKGLNDGLSALTAREITLYYAQDFIIEQEMGGLSGYFYHRLPESHAIRLTLDALNTLGFSEHFECLSEAFELFRDYENDDLTELPTWDDICKKLDPDDRLTRLDDRLLSSEPPC